MVVVLKLGGSVLTEKDRPETLDRASLDACAGAIGDRDRGLVPDGDLLLVHGGGSFGHYRAEEHGVSVVDGTDDPAAVLAVHDSMRRLNDAVVAALHEHGVPAVGVEPLSLASRDATGGLDLPTRSIAAMLAGGFVPVVFGDVVATAGDGFTVLSGDELAVALAAAFDADRVGMCSGVPGVFGADGEVLDHIDSLDDVAEAFGDVDGWDVTGGMAAKVGALLDLPAPAAVFGRDALPAFLAGEPAGTRIGRVDGA